MNNGVTITLMKRGSALALLLLLIALVIKQIDEPTLESPSKDPDHGLVSGQGPSIPDGLAIARRHSNDDVDIMLYEGSSWVTAVPSDTIPAYFSNSISTSPLTREIFSIMPAEGLNRIAFSVGYCSKKFGECGSRNFVYDRGADTLNEVGSNDTYPIAWLGDDSHLLMAGTFYGSIYSLETGLYQSLPQPTNELTETEEILYKLDYNHNSVLPESGRVLVESSNPPGMGILQLSSGGMTILENTSSTPFGGAWASLSPDGLSAVVIEREGQMNPLGAGELRIYSSAGNQLGMLTPPEYFDFSPVWADDGQKIVFLRSPTASLNDTYGEGDVYGAQGEYIPGNVLVHTLSTNTTTALTSHDVARRDIIVPDAGQVAIFREVSPEGASTYGINVSNGASTQILQDNTIHTAIGWASPD